VASPSIRKATSRGTALLVDEEALVRLSTGDMLGDLGYSVVEAESAEDALHSLGQGLAPDLLKADHLMPGMNGTDLARVLQSSNPNIQVLIVPGYAEDEGVAPDLPRLTKPFRNADLAAKLCRGYPSLAAWARARSPAAQRASAGVALLICLPNDTLS
jgi:CheY-like chemotaxis protein